MYSFQNYGLQQQIVRVNGEAGARSYRMAPNSSALVLDENNPLVWLLQTDGAGYQTAVPYKIELYVPEPSPDLNDILNRLDKLEGIINESNIKQNESGKQ